MDTTALTEAIKWWCVTEFELGRNQRIARQEPSTTNRRAVAIQKLHAEAARMQWADWLVDYIAWGEDTGSDFNEQVCRIVRGAESAALDYRIAGIRGRPLEDVFTPNLAWTCAVSQLVALNPERALRHASEHEEIFAGPTLSKA